MIAGLLAAATLALHLPDASGVAWTADDLARVTTRVDAALTDPAARGAHIGVLAVDTNRGTLLYARNADDLFAPGSTLKLVVGSVALETLGPAFTFETDVLATASGDLVLRGGGDAHLTSSDLDAAAAAVAASGRTRAGALVLDASRFTDRIAPGWAWDDLPNGYGAPVSALCLDDDLVHVRMRPGAKLGDTVTLDVSPHDPNIRIVNDATTGPQHSTDTTDIARIWNDPAAIRITGTYPADAGESDDFEPSAPDPETLAGDVFAQRLAARGVQIGGGIRSANTAPDARVIWSHHSAPLARMLAQMWLPSDNLMAELLLRELGMGATGPGSIERGVTAERAWLQSIGVDTAAMELADGSGLSAYDRITPRALVAILDRDWAGANRATILDALPVAGVRGTLAPSLQAADTVGRVFAKTGTVSHARALAGFAQTQRHGAVTLVLLLDDWNDAQPDAARALDRVRTAVASAFIDG